MTGKKKKCTAAIICILFVFVTFASLFYIVKEADHECTGENCPICACVHQAHLLSAELEKRTPRTVFMRPRGPGQFAELRREKSDFTSQPSQP